MDEYQVAQQADRIAELEAKARERERADFEERGTEEQIAALYGALSNAQGEFLEIGKATEGQSGHQRYKYATLAAVIKATKPALAKYGLSVIQPLSGLQGVNRIRTVVAHSGGGRLVITLEFVGAGDMKDFGKQITYQRRYSRNAVLGVDADEDAENQDGLQSGQNRPEEAPERRTQPRQQPPQRRPERAPERAPERPAPKPAKPLEADLAPAPDTTEVNNEPPNFEVSSGDNGETQEAPPMELMETTGETSNGRAATKDQSARIMALGKVLKLPKADLMALCVKQGGLQLNEMDGSTGKDGFAAATAIIKHLEGVAK